MNKYQTESLFETDQIPQVPCTHIIRVAFESGADSQFDYLVPDRLWPIETGQRVEVPFGRKNKPLIGFCTATDIEPEKSFAGRAKGRRLKIVAKTVDKQPLLDAELMELARWISSYYVCPLGQVLAAMVPSAVKKGIGVKKEKYIYLAAGSEKLCESVKSKKQKLIITSLQQQEAFGSSSAVQLQSLLEKIGCTNAPVKRLAQNLIVKITHRTIFKSMPAIPQGLSLSQKEEINLNDDQQKALTQINSRIESGQFSVTLLHGVTDSGKTELYIRAINTCLEKSRSAIVLLPEIALTAQTVQRFSSRFEKIAVMHSHLTATQRNVQWQKIKSGNADVVIGARSAVFAPLSNLGLIVVDEEHEPSYKQDTAPRYNGRDVAIKRSQLANAHCLLGSATPSLETLFNSRNKKHFSLVTLPKRVMDLSMPEMKLIDMRQQYPSARAFNLISEPLAQRLKEILEKKEQAILLLNRRGYSNIVYCPSCNHSLRCRNCDVTLTFHKSKLPAADRMRTVTGKHLDFGHAVCHYCLAQTLVPQKCPLCGAGFAMIGTGSQRLEEELAHKFPQAHVARVDSDSMAGADYYRVLKDFNRGEIDILAGTQMLAKGLHFPNVTVVGIISADTCLYLPDFRSNERTFQLISQVAGRTGRSEKKGTVFVQTFLPDQLPIQFALKNDFEGFISEELKHRRACNLPPFWRMAVVLLRDCNFEKLETACKAMREKIDFLVKQYQLEANVRGPLPAVISRIKRFHRMQIIIRAPEPVVFLQLFSALRSGAPLRPSVKVAIDIDPVNLL